MRYKMKNPLTDGLTVDDIKKVISALQKMDEKAANSAIEFELPKNDPYGEYLKGYCAGIRAGIHEVKTSRRKD